jgi:hypothetical protein
MKFTRHLVLASVGGLLLAADLPAIGEQPAAQIAPPAAGDRHGTDADRDAARAAAREAVLHLDQARFNAWQKGDIGKFGQAVAPDFVGIDGDGAPGKQIMTKADYLAYARAQRPAQTVVLSGNRALLFGFESDVAIVQGELGPDSSATGAGSGVGDFYSAIYVQDIMDGSWQLCRLMLSPLKVTLPPPPAPPPAPNWSIDDFSKTQSLVVQVLHDFFVAMDNHDINGMQRILDDNYIEIHGNGIRQFGKQEYLVSKSLSGGFPGLIGLDKPDVQFYGNYGDVAIIQGVRRDSDAGAIYGSDFTPHWRNVAYYIAVLQRSCAGSTASCARQHKDPNEWRLALYHATFVHTPGESPPPQ